MGVNDTSETAAICRRGRLQPPPHSPRQIVARLRDRRHPRTGQQRCRVPAGQDPPETRVHIHQLQGLQSSNHTDADRTATRLNASCGWCLLAGDHQPQRTDLSATPSMGSLAG
jgi:hypothetical protein